MPEWDEMQIRLFTCDECQFRYTRACTCKYDPYNQDGDCLMEK